MAAYLTIRVIKPLVGDTFTESVSEPDTNSGVSWHPCVKLYSKASLMVRAAPLIMRTPRSAAPLLWGSPVDAASGITSPGQERLSSFR